MTCAVKLTFWQLHTAGHITEKCASDIFHTWGYVEMKAQAFPESLAKFQTRLEKSIQAISGRSLNQWLKLGKKSKRKLETCRLTIFQNWTCQVPEILPHRYAPGKPLSPSILKGLADLSALTSLESGRQLLQEAIDQRGMFSRNGGRHSYGAFLTQQDVAKAIKEARETRNNAQAVADQSKRTEMGAGKKPTSNSCKRKRDAPPTSSPSIDSIALAEETLGKTPDETPDPIQQDLPYKKTRTGSWWPNLSFRKGHHRDISSLIPRTEMLDQDLAGHPSDLTTVVQETDVLDGGSTVHQSTPVPHQQEDGTTDEDLIFHRYGSKKYKGAKSQDTFANEVQGFHLMSPEQARGNTVPPFVDSDPYLGPTTTTTSPGNQSLFLDRDIGSPSHRALRVADAQPCGSANIDENRLRSITPLQRGSQSDGTHGTWAHEINDDDEVVATRPMVSTPSSIEKPNLQRPSSLGSLKGMSRPGIPTSDVQGALSSLRQAGTWLSSTAIQLTLEHCHAAGVRIFDPSFLSSASEKNLKSLSPGDSTLVFPLQVKGNHWALIVVDTANDTAEFWNSLSNPKHDIEAQNAVHNLGRSLRGGSDRMPNDAAPIEWIVTPQPCPSQDNSNDCGIYTIVFAMYRILNVPIPQSIDSHLWRQVLCILLDEGTELTLNDQEQHSAEGPISDPTKRAFRTAEVQDILRKDTTLLIQSLSRSQHNISSIQEIINLSCKFQERQTTLHEAYINKLHEATEKATGYKRMTDAFQELDMSDEDTTHLARTHTLLRKHEAKQAKIQSEFSRIERVVQGWARVTKACETEVAVRKGRVDEARDEIRGMVREQAALVEVVGRLQEELRACIS